MAVALTRHPLLVTALATLIPHLLGSAFNIWYNMTVVDPLLIAAGLKQRFIDTVIVWNPIAYLAGVGIWTYLILSLRPAFQRLGRAENVPADQLNRDRRRLVHLPWYGAAISGASWLLGAIAFLVSLAMTGRPMSAQLFWHLPISFGISGFIATTQGFFVIEWATQWGLFPLFFRDTRPDRLKGIHPISLRMRGFMWAVSATICPIGSLLLFLFAPPPPQPIPPCFSTL